MKKILLLKLFLLFCYLFINFSIYAQERVHRFGIFEKEIKNPINYANPYTDVELKVVLTESFNKQHFIKGFYDGDGTWKIRYSPDNPQKYDYYYQFTDNDELHTNHFFCTSSEPIKPIEVNPINPLWFKRAIDPFFVKGTYIDWSVLIKNDTTYLLQVKEMGFNLLYLENIKDKGLSLFPMNHNSYSKLEIALDWAYKNEFVIMLPINIFPSEQKPADQQEWNNYLSYFFSRLGVYRNIMLYVPDNDGVNNISVEEKNQIVSAITGNNPYQHPFAILNDNGKKFVNRHIQFNLISNNTEPERETQKIIPLIRIGVDAIHKDPKNVIHHLCKAFTSGNSFIIDYKKISNDATQQQVKELWDFFENTPYFDMKPISGLSNIGSCIGKGNDEYVLYIDKSEKVSLSLGNNYYRAMWVNPFSASNPIEGGIVSGRKELKAPFKNGSWLLHLSHKVSGFPQGIHLSWSEKTDESLTVTWSTVSENNPSKVKFRKIGTFEWLEQNGTTEKSPGGTVWIHSVVLRNLEPGTEYEYQVSADKSLEGVFSQVYQTRTAPAGDNSSFSFSFITDTGLVGRLDNNATGTQRIIDEVLTENPDFLLGGGDYGYANRDKRYKTVEGNINRWFEQYQPALAKMPFMAQYGNHELYLDETYEEWEPFFKHPKGFHDNRHYSFEIGNVHFTSFCLVNFLPTEEELEWLDKDLEQARLKNKWIIVYHHEPIFAYGSSHPAKLRLTEVIYPIFRKHNIDLSLSSHDQNYERTYPLTGTDVQNPKYNPNLNESRVYKRGEGTIFLKVSPGGKKSEKGNMFPVFQETYPPHMAIRDRTAHHLAVFNVKSGNSIEVRIYNVPEDDSPKYLIDRFIITREQMVDSY